MEKENSAQRLIREEREAQIKKLNRLREIEERNLAASKNLILQAQKGFDVAEIVDGIMDGTLNVLTPSDIAAKLRVPVESIHTWVRNETNQYKIPQYSTNIGLVDALRNYGKVTTPVEVDNDTRFPAPDFYIGRHPRWFENTLKNWLYNQIKKAD